MLNLLLSEWAKYEEADVSRQGGRRAEDFAEGTPTLGRRHMYPLCLLLQTGAAAPPPFKVTEFVVEENGTRLDGAEHITAAMAHSDQLEARLKPRRITTDPSESPGPASLKHTKWCEFQFVVSDIETVGANRCDEFSHALAVYSRPPTDSAAEWTRVACSAAPNSALDTKLANVAQRLRRDMDLTLVAITVTHVCDPSIAERRACAEEASAVCRAAQKKHRGE